MKGTKITLLILSFISLFTAKVTAQSNSCATATGLKGNIKADFSFQPKQTTRWFTFVATSSRIDMQIDRPFSVVDTPFAHIDSLILYTGTCGSLTPIKSIVKADSNSYDSLPDMQVLNLKSGQMYYLKVTRYSNNSDAGQASFGFSQSTLQAAIIPLCAVAACGPNLLCNGDFESPPIWASIDAYQDSSDLYAANPPSTPQNTYCITSPNMRYDTNFLGTSLCNGKPDITDIYRIGTTMGFAPFNNTSESGSWFMGVDCPSDFCGECSSNATTHCSNSLTTPNYTCIPWQQTITVIPGYTYIFECWVENMDAYPGYGSYSNGATVSMQINGASPFFEDVITGATYEKWAKVCYNWTAPAGITTAFIQVIGEGTSNPGGYDFALDNFSFAMAQLPAIAVNSATTSPCGNATLTVSPVITGATYLWSNGATTSSINVSPATTTTYSVTETVGTCTNTATGTVTVINGINVITASKPACSGTCNGMATASVTGGVTPYTYLWNNGQTTSSAIGLCAGNDGVKVVDASGCVVTTAVIVTANPTPTLCILDSTGTCPSGCVTLSGLCENQEPNVTYGWAPATGLSATNTATVNACPKTSTTYTIIATDTLTGCLAVGTEAVSIYNAPSITVTGTPPCSNACVGTATATATNGTGPYTYQWTNGQTTSTATALCSGTYKVSVTDAHGCTATATIKLLPIAPPKIIVTSASACPGASATITASGGISYVWSNGDTTSSITVNPTGTTSYTVTGNGGLCSNTAVGTVTVYNKPTYSYQAHGSCAGICNGTANFNVIGNTSPFTYSWATNGQTSTSASSTQLCAGNDTLFITDTHGCKTDVHFSIQALASPTVTATSDTICPGGTAHICAGGATTYQWSTNQSGQCVNVTPTATTTYNVTGTLNTCTATATSTVTVTAPPTVCVTDTIIVCPGSCTSLNAANAPCNPAGLTYSWAPTTGLTGNTHSSSVTACPTATTAYTVTVSNSKSGCSSTGVVVASVYTPATVTITSTPSCNNSCSGTATANISGGTSPYTYSWSGGATTSSITGACAGSYTVSVTDAHGCIVKSSVKISTISPPVIQATSVTACPGTNVTLSASGGSSYVWSNGATGSSITVNPTVQTTYTVTGSNGLCSNAAWATVSLYNRPTYTYTTHGSCSGECNGAANFILSGNTGPFTYYWAPIGLTTPYASTSHLCPGADTLIVTDRFGCKTDVDLNIATLPTPTVTATSDTICSGGTATVCASGANSYFWSTGANTTCITLNGLTHTSIYQLTGTTGTCTDVVYSTVTVLPAPTICLPDTVSICQETFATLNAVGGSCNASTVGITYSWAPTTGLTGNTNSSSVSASPIHTTTYTVTATNAAGCSTKGTVTVVVHDLPPYYITSYPTCAGACNGYGFLQVFGTLFNDAPFTFSWSPGGQTDEFPHTLCAGPDTVTVTDKYGCKLVLETYIHTTPIPTLTVSSDTICPGNTATICASGTTTYSWNTGATTSCINVSPLATSTYQLTGTVGACTVTTTSTVNVLPAPTICLAADTVKLCPGTCANLNAANGPCKEESLGLTYSWAPTTGLTGNTNSYYVSACPKVTTTYTVTATNKAGCSSKATVTVVVYNPSFTYSINTSATCAGTCIAIAIVHVTGSGAPFTYLWSPGGQTIANATNLCAGWDTLTVTDVHGCTLILPWDVKTAPTPTVIAKSDTICQGGVANICANGATTYAWNTGGTTACINVSPLSTSTYQVTGTLGKCTATATSTVTVAPFPTICFTTDTIKLCPGSCATLDAASKLCKASPKGLTYTWAPATGLTGNTSSYIVTACPTKTTTYTVTATNAAGCSSKATVTVVIYNRPTYTINAKPSCAGECNGVGVVTVGGYGSPFTYLWSPGGQTIADATTLCAGWDTLTVTDVYGCKLVLPWDVKTAPSPTLTVTSDTICQGGVANICASGATKYTWNTGGTTACINVSPLGTSTYQVTGTIGACTATATSTVTVEPLPTICLTTDTIKLCPGSCASLNAASKLCKASPKGLTYSWAPATGLTGNLNSYLVTACPTKTTTYTVTATNAAGCSKSATVTVVVYNPSFTYTINSTASCAGTCNGVALVHVNGSGAPLSYSWSPGGQTIADATNLCAGWDTLTVTDVHGCKLVLPWDVKTAPTPTVVAKSDTICIGGVANICASGATKYTWNTGGTTACINVSPLSTSTYQVTGTIGACTATATSTVTVESLPTICLTDTIKLCPGSCTTLNAASKLCKISPAGLKYNWAPATGLTGNLNSYYVTACPTKTTTYTVTATNAAGCSKTATVTVVVYNRPVYTITSKGSCAGTCNGLALVAVNGTDAPFTYLWSPGGQTIANATNLCAGIDSLTVTDKYGCTLELTTDVKTLPSPTLTVTSDTICQGGTAYICASGANTYLWNTTQTGACIHFSAFATTSAIHVTGTVGTCTATATSTVTVLPIPTICLAADTIKLCGGGCASLNAANGACKAQSVGLTYSWAPTTGLTGNLNSYYVTACPKQTTTYTVTATNAKGCSKSSTVTVVVYNSSFTYAINSTASCAGTCNGVALVHVNGSGTPFTYQWSPGGQTIADATTLCAGWDTLTVTDVHGCKLVLPWDVKTINTPTVTATSDTICAGGSATICANGGTNYMWSIGSTSQCLTVSPTTTTSYPVTATGGCGSDTAIATVYVLPAPSICLPDTVNVCPGTCASLNAANGPCKVQSVGLTYSWAPAAGLSGNLSSYYVTACPKQITTYTVTATNAAGCSKTDSVTVVPYTRPIFDYSLQGTCEGTCNGSAFVGLSPANYTFSWSPGGQTSNHPTNLCAGNDTVTITDTHGCTIVRPFVVPTIQSLALTATSDTICAGGSANICANGGTSYMWSIGSTSQCLTVSPATTTSYSVTATGGCGSDTVIAMVYVLPAPTICLPDTVGICPNTCASLNAACNGQSAGLTYSWAPATGLSGNTNSSSVTACPTKTTTYTVTATNASGCTKVDSVVVEPYTHLILDYALQGTCAGTCNGSVTTGLSPLTYTFIWSSGQTVNNPTNLCAGPDTLVSTDTHGCKRVLPVYIATIPATTLTVTSASICNGSSATICASGSTNYTWSTGSTMQCITVSPTTTTTYSVSSNAGKCGITTTETTVTVNNCPSIAPETKSGFGIESTATIYPNPAKASLNVSVNLGADEVDNICIYNSVGEAVKCATLKDALSTISTAELSAGLYFYRITDSNGTLIKSDKLMIVR